MVSWYCMLSDHLALVSGGPRILFVWYCLLCYCLSGTQLLPPYHHRTIEDYVSTLKYFEQMDFSMLLLSKSKDHLMNCCLFHFIEFAQDLEEFLPWIRSENIDRSCLKILTYLGQKHWQRVPEKIFVRHSQPSDLLSHHRLLAVRNDNRRIAY